MNDTQKKVVKILDQAVPKKELKKWLVGYIPKHYKRLSISMAEANELAVTGATEAVAYFGTKLYFTQALLFGAVASGRYQKFIVVTPSQYGKSWLCGQLALWLANKNHQVYVSGGNTNTTEIIMNKTIGHIQHADREITDKLLETADKLERLQTSLSKKKLSFRGGGSVEGLSLGDTFNNPLKSNQAVGRGGDFIVDEASLISDDAYAEMGRREFAQEVGDPYISFEISNPHNPGRFFDKLTHTTIPKGTLIVWMDIRTAYEEGRVKSKEQVLESEFFQNKSTCKRYLLCELEDYSEASLFEPVTCDDSELSEELEYCLGVDSAYKGEDGIATVLSAVDRQGKIRVLDHVAIKKEHWVDGRTGEEVVQSLVKIIQTYHVKHVCVDVGYGVYIVEGLAKRAQDFTVTPIAFGSGTTDYRKKAGHYAAVQGANKRAEMHLDLADLIENQRLSMTSEMHALVKEQLNAVQVYHKSGDVKPKTAIIPKDDIKKKIGKSPDELDATLLSVHAVLLHRLEQKVLLYQGD